MIFRNRSLGLCSEKLAGRPTTSSAGEIPFTLLKSGGGLPNEASGV